MFTFDLDDFELAPVAPGLRVSFPVLSATGTASTSRRGRRRRTARNAAFAVAPVASPSSTTMAVLPSRGTCGRSPR